MKLPVVVTDMTLIRVDKPITMQHPDNPDLRILVQDFFFWHEEKLEMVPKGFVTDLASIPRIFWNITNPMELGDTAPIKHDWRYRNKLGTRKHADDEFLADMTMDKIPAWRRYPAYWMVRLRGGSRWGKEKVVIEELEGAK